MIKIENLNKSFDNFQVLKNINLEIKKGDIFGIIGHSGAGKSTLLRCLNGLETYDSGNLKILDKEIKTLNSKNMRILRKDIGMIFQNFNLLNSMNVYENIALPLKIWDKDKNFIDNKVKNLIKIVELEDKLYNSINSLSGGQKQRVAIARALILEPEILLCDEATSALDPRTTKSILSLLNKINKDLNITIVLVTHQMEVIKGICNKVAIMNKGIIETCDYVNKLFLSSNKHIKNLLGETEVLPNEGLNIKIYFGGNASKDHIITSMARDLNINFSIVWGKLEQFRDNVLGSLIINADNIEKENIINYLEKNSINFEVI